MSEKIQRLLDASNCFIADNIAGEIHLLQKEITRLQRIVEKQSAAISYEIEDLFMYEGSEDYDERRLRLEKALSLTATEKETK